MRPLAVVFALFTLAILGFIYFDSEPTDQQKITGIGDSSSESRGVDAPRLTQARRNIASQVPTSRPMDSVLADETTVQDTAMSQPARLATIDVTAVWADDDRPAAGMGIRLLAWSDPNPFVRQRTAVANREGKARFEAVRPGSMLISATLGGGKSMTARAGTTEAVVLRLEAGFTIRGIVVDGAGEPVSGAQIAVGDVFDERIAANTGGDGRFVLRGGRNGMTIAARAAHHPPSPRHYAWGKPADTIDLRIMLQGRAARVHGRVVDENGTPVPMARVLVGARERISQDLGGGVHGIVPPPTAAITNTEGYWEAGPVAALRLPILVRADGFAPWKGDFDATQGDGTVPDMRLERGVIVYGIVRHSSGTPATDVTIMSGGYGDPDSCMARTDSKGAFRIVDLPRACKVTASAGNVGRATREIAAAEGVEIEWNPLLEEGAVIRGRIVDENALPRVDWMIEVGRIDMRSQWRGQTTTDADGRFVVRNCITEADLYLEICQPKHSMQFPVRRMEPLRPNGPDLEIRITTADIPSAYVSGRVLDENGAMVMAGHVTVWVDDASSHPSVSLEKDGSFSIGPFSPGPYSLSLSIPYRPRQALGRFDLVQDQRLDIGVVTLEHPGNATIQPADPTDPEIRDLHVVLRSGRITIDTTFRDARWTSNDAAPGTYDIECYRSGKRISLGTVKIAAGTTSSVNVRIPAREDR